MHVAFPQPRHADAHKSRSLQQFADASVEQLAEHFDLLVIDHPSVGACAAAGALLPLDHKTLLSLDASRVGVRSEGVPSAA